MDAQHSAALPCLPYLWPPVGPRYYWVRNDTPNLAAGTACRRAGRTLGQAQNSYYCSNHHGCSGFWAGGAYLFGPGQDLAYYCLRIYFRLCQHGGDHGASVNADRTGRAGSASQCHRFTNHRLQYRPCAGTAGSILAHYIHRHRRKCIPCKRNQFPVRHWGIVDSENAI